MIWNEKWNRKKIQEFFTISIWREINSREFESPIIYPIKNSENFRLSMLYKIAISELQESRKLNSRKNLGGAKNIFTPHSVEITEFYCHNFYAKILWNQLFAKELY